MKEDEELAIDVGAGKIFNCRKPTSIKHAGEIINAMRKSNREGNHLTDKEEVNCIDAILDALEEKA